MANFFRFVEADIENEVDGTYTLMDREEIRNADLDVETGLVTIYFGTEDKPNDCHYLTMDVTDIRKIFESMMENVRLEMKHLKEK